MAPDQDAPNVVPNIQDKRKPAPGVLPKNAQTLVVIGLSAVIVLMLWISGPAKGAQSVKKSDAAKTDPVVGLSPAVIVARLEPERREQQAPLVHADRPRSWQEEGEDHPGSSAGNSEAAAPAEPDPIRQDMRRREYTSRFASSVSLSYRPLPVADSSRTEENSASQPPMDLSALGFSNRAGRMTSGPEILARSAVSGLDPPPQKNQPSFNQASGKDYVVFESTVLETLLVTRLNSDFSGPVICMLTSSVYSHDGQRLLVPAGTKVLGQTKRVEAFGQTRLAVAFHRLILPDGRTVGLDQFTGLNQRGDAALRDQVNHHYWSTFGAASAVGLISGLGQYLSTIGFGQGSGDRTMVIAGGFGNATSEATAQVMNRFLNRLPTVTIREGHRVKVYLTSDLELPAYEERTPVPPSAAARVP